MFLTRPGVDPLSNRTGEEGSCLVIAMEYWPPYTFVSGRPPNVVFSGICVDITRIIAEKLGLCYKLVRSPDSHLMGSLQPNGSYTGVMGLLKRQEADASLSLYSISYERSKHIDFSIPVFIDEWRVVYKRPTIEADLMGFVKPYTSWMWLYLLLTLLVVLAVTVSLQWCWDTSQAPAGSRGASVWIYYNKYFLWILGLLLTHSMGWYPRGESGRMIATMWLLAGIVLSTVYKSNLKAMLIRPSVHIAFKNLEEMLEQNEYPYKVPYENLPHQIMREAPPDSLYGRVYAGLSGVLLPSQYETAINDAIEGKLAIFVGYDFALSTQESIFSKTGGCPFYVIPNGFLKNNPVAMIFPIGSPFREKVNKILQRLNEHGILSHVKNTYLHNATYCMGQPGSDAKDKLRSLEMGDFIGVFLLFGAGMLVAALCLLVEVTVAAVMKD